MKLLEYNSGKQNNIDSDFIAHRVNDLTIGF